VGARPRAWAENEEQQVPTYEEAIRRVGAHGQRILDVACANALLSLAALAITSAVFGSIMRFKPTKRFAFDLNPSPFCDRVVHG
jgi:hypothetical protein